MIPIHQKDILSAYNYYKANAVKHSSKSEHEQSLASISLCAKIAYHSNFFFSDVQLEECLEKVAKELLPALKYRIHPDRYVLIDTNGTDNHGLTQQYIRAFIQMGVEFAYIYESTDLSRIPLILEELKGCEKATIFTFDQEYSQVEQIKRIADFVKEYRPERYFMHIMPWDVVATSICSILDQTVRYNINLTDHAFWLGAKFIDYSIEFRDFGATISLEKRGLSKQQLLKVPYYPLINRSEFKGLPKGSNKITVKMFSGGSFYKIYGEHDKFFYLVKRLLTENEHVELFYAGGGNHKPFKQFLIKNGLSDRVHLIGSRSDILEVFENIDIYLGTYPISGGLMSQYAALCGKPILAYTDPKYATNFVEGFINHRKQHTITKVTEDRFFDYASRLCQSQEYRLSEGTKLLDSVISPAAFASELKSALLSNQNQCEIRLENIDYESFSSLYLEVENQFEFNIQRLVAYNLRSRIVLFPKFFANAIFIFFRKFIFKTL